MNWLLAPVLLIGAALVAGVCIIVIGGVIVIVDRIMSWRDDR